MAISLSSFLVFIRCMWQVEALPILPIAPKDGYLNFLFFRLSSFYEAGRALPLQASVWIATFISFSLVRLLSMRQVEALPLLASANMALPPFPFHCLSSLHETGGGVAYTSERQDGPTSFPFS